MFDIVKGCPNDLAVTAKDGLTLEVVLANNVAYWHELTAFPTYMPVREDVVANEAWSADPSTYICNGVYTMSAWEHDAYSTLTKNEKHHDAAAVTMPAELGLTSFGYDIKVEDGTWAETYDVLIAEIKACTNNETRIALMHCAEDLLMSTGVIVPLYFHTDTYMIDDSVQGFFCIHLDYKYFMYTSIAK